MKITKRQLRRIIREGMQHLFLEAVGIETDWQNLTDDIEVLLDRLRNGDMNNSSPEPETAVMSLEKISGALPDDFAGQDTLLRLMEDLRALMEVQRKDVDDKGGNVETSSGNVGYNERGENSMLAGFLGDKYTALKNHIEKLAMANESFRRRRL